jgi:hypothetical protein
MDFVLNVSNAAAVIQSGGASGKKAAPEEE